MFPWAHRLMNSTKIPNIYPAASTAIIGATVTMLTSITEGCFSGSFESTYSWYILAQIPLSRICANLRRILFCIKDLIYPHCLKNYYNIITDMAVLNQTKNHWWMLDVDHSETVRYLKAMSLVVTKGNYVNPLLSLDIRQRVWTGNFRKCIIAFYLQFRIYLTYSKLWQCPKY